MITKYFLAFDATWKVADSYEEQGLQRADLLSGRQVRIVSDPGLPFPFGHREATLTFDKHGRKGPEILIVEFGLLESGPKVSWKGVGLSRTTGVPCQIHGACVFQGTIPCLWQPSEKMWQLLVEPMRCMLCQDLHCPFYECRHHGFALP